MDCVLNMFLTNFDFTQDSNYDDVTPHINQSVAQDAFMSVDDVSSFIYLSSHSNFVLIWSINCSDTTIWGGQLGMW
jgi:hypothetical protein